MESDTVTRPSKEQGLTIEALTENCQLETLEEHLLHTMEEYRVRNSKRTYYTNREMSVCVDLPPQISILVHWACDSLYQPHVVCIRALECIRRYLFARYSQLKQLHGTVSRSILMEENKANSWIVRCLICVQIAAKWHAVSRIIPIKELQKALKNLGEEISIEELAITESHLLETLEFRIGFPTLVDFTGTLMSLLTIRFHYTSLSTYKAFTDNSTRISAVSLNLLMLYSLDTQKFFDNVFSVFTIPLPPETNDRSSWLDIKNNDLLVAACSIAGAIRVIEEEELFYPVITELSAFTDIPATDIEVVTPVLVDLLYTDCQTASGFDRA